MNKNIRSPNPVSVAAKRSLQISKEAFHTHHFPKRLNELSSRELYIEMREQILA